MTESKGRPKLSPQQLRKLFAAGILSAHGKGDKRKVAYDKPKVAALRKTDGGGPRTVSERLARLQDIATGKGSAKTLPERTGRYLERAKAAEQQALARLRATYNAKDFGSNAWRQRKDTANSRLERIRTIKSGIEKAKIPESTNQVVQQAGKGAAAALARRAAIAAKDATAMAEYRRAQLARQHPQVQAKRIENLLWRVKGKQRKLYSKEDTHSNKDRARRYGVLKSRERKLQDLQALLTDQFGTWATGR